jgi:hypothetical protein
MVDNDTIIKQPSLFNRQELPTIELYKDDDCDDNHADNENELGEDSLHEIVSPPPTVVDVSVPPAPISPLAYHHRQRQQQMMRHLNLIDH